MLNVMEKITKTTNNYSDLGTVALAVDPLGRRNE